MKSFFDNDHLDFSNMKESGADNGKGNGPSGENTSVEPLVTSYSPGIGKGGAAAVEWTYAPAGDKDAVEVEWTYAPGGKDEVEVEWTYAPSGKDEVEVEWTYATAGHDDGFL